MNEPLANLFPHLGQRLLADGIAFLADGFEQLAGEVGRFQLVALVGDR